MFALHGFKSDNYHNSLTDCYATLVSYNGIYKVRIEGRNSEGIMNILIVKKDNIDDNELLRFF